MTFRDLIESKNYEELSKKELEMLLSHHEDDLKELKDEGGDTEHTERDIKRIKAALAKVG